MVQKYCKTVSDAVECIIGRTITRPAPRSPARDNYLKYKDMEQTTMMTVGETFPQLLGVDARGEQVKRSNFPGMKLIVYFYPKDNTPGCTAEACSLRDGYAALQEAGYQVIGVSKDSEASHRKFAEKYALPFPLISDPDQRLCREVGVWQLKKMAGRQ